ncbi:MAG: hypothetical protein ACP5NL_07335 [Thermoplasmata archaeon]
MMKIFKSLSYFLFLMLLFSLISASFGSGFTDFDHSNTISTSSYTDPFTVHSVSGLNNFAVFLPSETYFIDIVGDINSNFTFSIKGSDTSLSMWVQGISTKMFAFHGIIINTTGVYNITTDGNGSWVISLNAQSSNYLYRYNISNTSTFVLVPETVNSNAIEINVLNSSKISISIYDSILEKVSYSKNSENNILLSTNSPYDKVIFLNIIGNGSVAIKWISYSGSTNNNYAEPINGLMALEILIVFIFITFAIVEVVLYLRKRSREK